MNNLFPRLEMLFDEYNMPGIVVRFNTLKINFSVNNVKNLEDIKSEINEKLENSFKQHFELEVLPDSVATQQGKHILLLKDLEISFLFFLENGYLPWFGKKEALLDFVASDNWGKSVDNDEFVTRISRLVNKNAKIRFRFLSFMPARAVVSFLIRKERIFKEYDDVLFSFFEETDLTFKTALFEVLTLKTGKQVSAALKTVVNALRSISGKIDEIKVRRFLKMLRSVLPVELMEEEADVIALIKKEIEIQEKEADVIKLTKNIQSIQSKERQKEYVKENELKKEEEDLIQMKGAADIALEILSKEEFDISENFFDETDVQEVFVVNAGLILLHPFFGQLFGTLGYLDDMKMILKSKTDIAVQTLHYIATGSEDFFEGDLLLEKFICNVPLKWPVNTESLLTKKIKDEVEVMMQEAVRHWPALKNTSPGGLRQMFISRDGKLIEQPKGYKLIVERKAQDVLLEKLNWNISLVKFPWKKELITVEW